MWASSNLLGTNWREFQDKANTTGFKPISPASYAKYEANWKQKKYIINNLYVIAAHSGLLLTILWLQNLKGSEKMCTRECNSLYLADCSTSRGNMDKLLSMFQGWIMRNPLKLKLTASALHISQSASDGPRWKVFNTWPVISPSCSAEIHDRDLDQSSDVNELREAEQSYSTNSSYDVVFSQMRARGFVG